MLTSLLNLLIISLPGSSSKSSVYTNESTNKNANNVSNCHGDHVLTTKKGECYCEQGYIMSKINDSHIICYNCSKQCHKKAECVAQDECKCKGKFIGDGIDCHPPIPVIRSISVYDDTYPVLINVEYNDIDFDPYAAFCMFGSVKATAILNTNNKTITCIQPSVTEKDCSLKISFDGILFSNEVDYSPRTHNNIDTRVVRIYKRIRIQKSQINRTKLFVGIFSSIFWGIIAFKYNSNRAIAIRSDEDVILIKHS